MPRILFALLLALSVGIKLGLGGAPASGETASATEEDLAAFLARQGFQLGETYNQTDIPLLSATLDDCRLLVAIVSPQGWHRDILHRLASPPDQVHFVADGSVYDDQPKWRTWTRHYWQRLNRTVGRRLPVRPVLGVIASPECRLQDIAWRDLAALP